MTLIYFQIKISRINSLNQYFKICWSNRIKQKNLLNNENEINKKLHVINIFN